MTRMKPGPDGTYPDERERWDRAVAGGQAAINRYFAGYHRRVRAAVDRKRWAEADALAAYRRDRNAARMWRTRHPEEAAAQDAKRQAEAEADRKSRLVQAEATRQRVMRKNRAIR